MAKFKNLGQFYECNEWVVLCIEPTPYYQGLFKVIVLDLPEPTDINFVGQILHIPNTDKWNEVKVELFTDKFKLIDTDTLKKISVDEVKFLATRIHDKTCKSNHQDQCGFHYDDDWTRSKKEYFDKAKDILSEVSYEAALTVINKL